MLCCDNEVSSSSKYFSSLAQLMTSKRRSDRDSWLREKYAETIEMIHKKDILTI